VPLLLNDKSCTTKRLSKPLDLKVLSGKSACARITQVSQITGFCSNMYYDIDIQYLRKRRAENNIIMLRLYLAKIALCIELLLLASEERRKVLPSK